MGQRVRLPQGFRCKIKHSVHDMPVGSEIIIEKDLVYATHGGYHFEVRFVGDTKKIENLNLSGPFVKITDLDVNLEALETLYGR